ncbi:MAG: ribonuclease P protein component [bacterium]
MSKDLSFPPERRLTKSTRIQSILNRGNIFKGKYCHLFLGERDDKMTRAAFVVSEKSASKATLRNRLKRLMRESFRLLQPELEEGWPLVFLAKRNVHSDLKRQHFDRDLQDLMGEAGILQDA